MDDETCVYDISEVRTFSIRGEPGQAILKITAAGENFYFEVHVEDLMGLGKQLQIDARLLSNRPAKQES